MGKKKKNYKHTSMKIKDLSELIINGEEYFTEEQANQYADKIEREMGLKDGE